MPNFCVKCGSPLTSGPFCIKCGTRSPSQSVPPQPSAMPAQPAPTMVSPAQPAPQLVAAPPAVPVAAQPAPARQGMSTLAKLGIAAVAIIFVGGAAGAVGVYYVAHRVSQKYHEVKEQVLGSSSGSGAGSGENSPDNGSGERSPSGGSDSSSSSMGNVCRFLSKEDVSKAIGVEIIRAEAGDNTCNYIAKGTQADMTAKHAAAMLGDRGADKKTQQMAEQFAGGIFKMTQESRAPSPQDASGEVPVFNFGLDQNDAEAQMRLNAKVLGNLGDQQGLPGIGDQAFVSADGMIMVRKGKTLVRIMYLTCPCGLEQVKPLAKEIADAL